MQQTIDDLSDSTPPRLIFSTLYPISEHLRHCGADYQYIDRMNAHLRSEFLNSVDVVPEFMEQPHQDLTSDGLHLKPAGAQLIGTLHSLHNAAYGKCATGAYCSCDPDGANATDCGTAGVCVNGLCIEGSSHLCNQDSDCNTGGGEACVMPVGGTPDQKPQRYCRNADQTWEDAKPCTVETETTDCTDDERCEQRPCRSNGSSGVDTPCDDDTDCTGNGSPATCDEALGVCENACPATGDFCVLE